MVGRVQASVYIAGVDAVRLVVINLISAKAVIDVS